MHLFSVFASFSLCGMHANTALFTPFDGVNSRISAPSVEYSLQSEYDKSNHTSFESWWIQFIDCMRKENRKDSGKRTMSELNAAIQRILELVQMDWLNTPLAAMPFDSLSDAFAFCLL